MASYANIIVTIPHKEAFTYRIPNSVKHWVEPGVQVIIPFGVRYVSGIVLEVINRRPTNLAEKDIKDIHDLVLPELLIQPELMKLLKWISDYYICQLGEAYRLIQSQLNVEKSQVIFRRVTEKVPVNLSEKLRKLLDIIPADKTITLTQLRKRAGSRFKFTILTELEKQKLISREHSEMRKKEIFLHEDHYKSTDEEETYKKQGEFIKRISARKSKGWAALEYLQGKDWVSITDLKTAGYGKVLLEKLVQKELILKKTEIKPRHIPQGYQEDVPDVTLTNEQSDIVKDISSAIKKGSFQAFLLHGITGSGKTQVYIELIRKVVQEKKQAIVLIPEIILTPQTLARFRHYFGQQVAVIHSRLSAGEKREILYKIRMGEFSIVIGPRSAIFAPLKNLGLIIVDEEHESSYKQNDAVPHYHARDVAIYRAKLNNAVVVLGSATPSFETLYNVEQKHFSYFRLGKRIAARNLPRIAIIDLKEEWKKGGELPIISENLELKIESRLLIKEQIMILQNRRGYSPYIICGDCGFIAKCTHCDITLTFHHYQHQLLCHYCGRYEKAPDLCPDCQGRDILFKGIGTQKLEQLFHQKFSAAKVIRMDQDTTRGKYAHMQLLEKFRKGDADILLGTKMIAKGLDFQKLTLVGIVSADQGLHFPDFRASEKVFQLLTQAAGRAGRGSHSGEVVVQTMDPAHIIYKFLNTHDYLSFFKKELASRKNLKYPPFSRLILIRLEGKDPELLQDYGQNVVQFLWKANREKLYTVLGPAPSPIAKIQNMYRYQILIKQEKQKDASLTYIRHILRETFLKKKNIKKWPVKVIIDVDPIEIL
jgi:primosomal protein N' (replication factor Y)